jgi:RecB family endonuclease NucS
MRFNRVYDFQKALCEDPELISNWFRLVENIQAKYNIIDSDIYNFDKTGFIIGQIASRIVITRVDRYSKNKAIQLSNQE